MARPSQFDLGVDPRIEDIDDEVGGDGERAKQDRDPQDGGIVAVERAVDEGLADAAGGKNRGR